ncbi:hypothetical protein ACLKA7_007993 [Drosophila subpalustris]
MSTMNTTWEKKTFGQIHCHATRLIASAAGVDDDVAVDVCGSWQLAHGRGRGQNFDLSGRKSQAQHALELHAVPEREWGRPSPMGNSHGMLINRRAECEAVSGPQSRPEQGIDET